MSLFRASPATDMDLACCLPQATLQIWAAARLQLTMGPSWALRDAAGAAVACGGFVERGGGLAEGWLLMAPAARRHMLEIVRAIRLTGAATPYRRRIVKVTTPEGRRIARAAGYRTLIANSNGMEIMQ
jgi:hypothetical protein